MKWIAQVILLLVVGLIDAIVKKFQKKPEQVEKEKHENSLNTTIDRINKHDPGYRLPRSAESDKWGPSVNP